MTRQRHRGGRPAGRRQAPGKTPRCADVQSDGPEHDGGWCCGQPPIRPCGVWRKRGAAVHRPAHRARPQMSPTHTRDGPEDRDGVALRTSGGHEFARSGRDSSAALEPTGSKDVAAGSGGHPGTETVLLGSTSVIGLECALHGMPPRSSGLVSAFKSMLFDRNTGERTDSSFRNEAGSPTPVRATR